MLDFGLAKHQADEPTKNEDENDSMKDQKEKKKPYALQKPANTALRQQRLKAWHPILSHSTVLPILFGMGVFFAVLGGVMYWSSVRVNELTIEYSSCRDEAPQSGPPENIPSKYYKYRFHSKRDLKNMQPPQWSAERIQPGPGREKNPARYRCTISFSIPEQLDPGVFLYYKLTNFYQNHRRYMKSMDYLQLLNKPRTADELQSDQCKPLGRDPHTNLAVYPCGLIANSVFNDTFTSPIMLDEGGKEISTYNMSEKNIIWQSEYKHYKTPTYNASEIVPPPYWQGAEGPFGYPSGRYEEGKVFDPSKNEHFQVWMRTAAFPHFRKLYMRNDNDPMNVGRYSIEIKDNYPVNMFHGTKAIVLSTASWVGGRSIVMGASHIAVAALCFLLGFALTGMQLARPRRVGDTRYLSWNNPPKQRT